MQTEEKIEIVADVVYTTLTILQNLASDVENLAGINFFNLKSDLEKEKKNLEKIYK